MQGILYTADSDSEELIPSGASERPLALWIGWPPWKMLSKMLSKFLLLSLAAYCAGGRLLRPVTRSDDKTSLVYEATTVMPASTSLLSVTFPHTEAGLPAIYLGGVLWAESAPIIVGAQGARCSVTAPSGATTTGTGSDAWGAYTWTATPYVACGTSLEALVAVYHGVPAARFTITFPEGAVGTNLSNATTSPNLAPIAAFPSIPADAPWPGQHNFAWAGGQLGFSAQATVSTQTFSGQTGNVPSPMFFTDVTGSNATLCVAPMDHAHGWACNALAQVGVVSEEVAWGCGIMNTVASLPSGFSATTLLFGGVGVTATLSAWGSALQAAFNTTRLPDVQTTKLGIYTDNGAFCASSNESPSGMCRTSATIQTCR